MEFLDKEIISVAAEFRKGHFIVQKSNRAFRQFHLTENSCQLRRWMVCGSEVSRLINEFKSLEELMKKAKRGA